MSDSYVARSKRRTVLAALGAMALTATGGGVYYAATASGWLTGQDELVLMESDATAAVPAVAVDLRSQENSEQSQANMDALANAWAAAGTAAGGAEHTDDRYAVTEVAADAGAGTEAANIEGASDGADAKSVVEEKVVKQDSLAALPVALPEDVARGQAPTELDADDTFAPPEPQAVAEPRGGASIESSRRAREAFGAAMAEASASDRYGAPGEMQPPAPVATAPRSGGVNPFEGGGGTGAAATGSAATGPAALDATPQHVPVEANTQYDPQPMRAASSMYRDAAEPVPSRFDGAADPSPSAGGLPIGGDLSSGEESFGSESLGGDGVEGTGRPGERALEGQQNAALVIQKFAPPEIQVGKAAKFAVQVRNAGSQTARGVVIRDEVPAGTRVVSTTPKAESDGNSLVWALGELSTGEERTVEVELMPTKEGEIGSVATVTCAAQASTKTRCTMPQLAIRMTAPSQVLVGQEQRVKIELRNPGTGDATGVMLLENVPDNVRHAAGPALEFEIGTLRAGETRELELVLLAERAGPVANLLTARADGNLQVQQQVDFEVIAPALQISVDGPARRYLERPATYQVTVENPGTAPAHDIEIVSKLPKGMQFVKANNMGEYDAATHSVYWSLAQLPEGEKGAVELVAMPIEPGEQTLQIQGRAQQGLSDEAEREVIVEGLAALMFEVRDAEDPIEVGGETNYEIRVVNQGTKAATNVQVVVNLPPGIQAISASGETRHDVQAGGVVFEPLAQLAPKTDSVFRVQVKGVQPGDQRTSVQVRTDGMKEIRREESTQVFGDE